MGQDRPQSAAGPAPAGAGRAAVVERSPRPIQRRFSDQAGAMRVRRRLATRMVQLLVLSGLALAAFVLGAIGAHGTLAGRFLTGLSVFQTGFPGPGKGDSTLLTIGKNVGPVVTLSAAVTVIAALFRREFTAFRARRRRNHVVVCGLGEKGLRVARAFRRDGQTVTCIDLDAGSDAAMDARTRGALVLEGDATHLHALTTARIDRAARVVCACPDDSANARHFFSRCDFAFRASPSRTGKVNRPYLAASFHGREK